MYKIKRFNANTEESSGYNKIGKASKAAIGLGTVGAAGLNIAGAAQSNKSLDILAKGGTPNIDAYANHMRNITNMTKNDWKLNNEMIKSTGNETLIKSNKHANNARNLFKGAKVAKAAAGIGAGVYLGNKIVKKINEGKNK